MSQLTRTEKKSSNSAKTSAPHDVLYIVDGESSGGALKSFLRLHAYQGYEILVWRDSLYEGPVPQCLSLKQLSRIRARYWASTLPPRSQFCPRDVPAEFSERDRRLHRFRDFQEILLWFGPGVVCQLSLIQLLDWFRDQDRHDIKFSIIDSTQLAQLTPERLGRSFETSRRVTDVHFRLARKAWQAYTAPDPGLLNRFLGRDSGTLPHLRPALLSQAREYPDKRSGLSRLERRLLPYLAQLGPSRPASLVGRALAEETYGDIILFDMLRRFVRANNQLLRFDRPFRGDLDTEFNRSWLVLTDFGRKALRGQVDVIPFNGIDRWIGGVRLHGQDCPWRWSEVERQVVAVG